MSKTLVEQQPGFDPETHCRYTGQLMRQVPYRTCDGQLRVWYVRECDGNNMCSEAVTGAQLAWAEAHPVETQKAIDSGREWHRAAARLKYK